MTRPSRWPASAMPTGRGLPTNCPTNCRNRNFPTDCPNRNCPTDWSFLRTTRNPTRMNREEPCVCLPFTRPSTRIPTRSPGNSLSGAWRGGSPARATRWIPAPKPRSCRFRHRTKSNPARRFAMRGCIFRWPLDPKRSIGPVRKFSTRPMACSGSSKRGHLHALLLFTPPSSPPAPPPPRRGGSGWPVRS